ncbi:response regulator [uncultured Roseibium sp.]|uniref:ATP-binding response regulator n=1 Tax=uncultured Roseibium sp. TaxID=1936171 RepID=UPI00260169FD|nr:response regulator [uncultured Roseibium sp.]
MANHDEDGAKIALLAHDLRTPLAAMRLTAEMIGEGSLDIAQAEQLSVLIRSIDALTQLTGDLLNAGEQDENAPSATYRISEIMLEVTDLFRPVAEAKNLTLDVVLDEDTREKLIRDGGSLRRVLTSLLDNAVKYTDTGGIIVELSTVASNEPSSSRAIDDNWVNLSITDTGPGIDPEERERLFRPFVRGRHGKASAPGTGLGLWGTAELVREMKGLLRLAQPKSGGSCFEVQIPLQTQDTIDRRPEPAPSSDMEPVASRPGMTMHILVVDDNETNCRLLAALLESFGMSCDIAHSGEQAIVLIQKEKYDAALLDLHMPGMSGLETAEELRNLEPGGEPPLIAVTAALESIGDQRLRQAGFQEVLTKPLSPALLYKALEHANRLNLAP